MSTPVRASSAPFMIILALFAVLLLLDLSLGPDPLAVVAFAPLVLWLVVLIILRRQR